MVGLFNGIKYNPEVAVLCGFHHAEKKKMKECVKKMKNPIARVRTRCYNPAHTTAKRV